MAQKHATTEHSGYKANYFSWAKTSQTKHIMGGKWNIITCISSNQV